MSCNRRSQKSFCKTFFLFLKIDAILYPVNLEVIAYETYPIALHFSISPLFNP